MNKCPNCGGDTREIDRFCLHCGYPLTSNPAPYQQEQQHVGESTLPSPDEWGIPVQNTGGETNWGGSNSPTIAESASFNGFEPATMRSDAQPVAQEASTAQATMNRIEEPARLLLRSDSGEITQEYPLDKHEITIGRAPASDILLSKDKLTSRRHATIHFENNQYILRDERSANGTFVNGQQIEELAPRVLQDGDHIGVGEHELIFHTHTAIEDMPTVSVNYNNASSEPMTYRTREDTMATALNDDEYGTRSMDNSGFVDGQASPDVQDGQSEQVEPVAQEPQPQTLEAEEPQPETPVASATSASQEQQVPVANASVASAAFSSPSEVAQTSQTPQTPEVAPSIPVDSSFESESSATPSVSAVAAQTPTSTTRASGSSGAMQSQNYTPSATTGSGTDTPVTFNRLTGISQTGLPDMTALTAALSALDGQVMSLQEQLNTTQEAMHNHDAEVAQTANQLRTGVRRVSERMDATIADVARSREALAWSELSQLMEEVMNNPRDIEYVTRLARKARELNKLFQIHQNVLNTMYECNSLLRGLIGEDR